MAIEVRNVDKRFGDFVALEDVSMTVADGSLTALLGPSGSGKSTLLRVIAGLETPDRGEVVIAGEDVTLMPARERGVGFVFQHYAPFKHMTVGENIGFGLSVRKRPKAEVAARVRELLGLVRLDGLAGRYPSQLSGGQRWLPSRRSSCWMSRSARWTPRSGASFGSGCGVCTTRST